MAQIDTTGLQAVLNDLRKLGEAAEPVAQVMTAAAAEEITAAWKQTAEEYGFRDTGAMIDSVGYPDGVQNMGGLFVADIYPQGKDARGTRNAEKAFILHYGSSRIKPSYWTDEADKRAGEPVQQRLEGIWGDFLETGQVPAVPLQSIKYKRKGTKKTKV